jgi:hypothetical protein
LAICDELATSNRYVFAHTYNGDPVIVDMCNLMELLFKFSVLA